MGNFTFRKENTFEKRFTGGIGNEFAGSLCLGFTIVACGILVP